MNEEEIEIDSSNPSLQRMNQWMEILINRVDIEKCKIFLIGTHLKDKIEIKEKYGKEMIQEIENHYLKCKNEREIYPSIQEKFVIDSLQSIGIQELKDYIIQGKIYKRQTNN